MATVMVRNLPDEDYRWLRDQAAANGRSMEAELRALLAKHRVLSPKRAPAQKAAKGRAKKGSLSLLTAKERKALKPDAQAALQRLREMFADRKGEARKSMVDEFLAGRREMWGEK
jgi:plasmid stability protein